MMGSRDPAPEVGRRCNMPHTQGGWFYDEHPRHKVTLTTPFYTAIHEVTQACYEPVVTLPAQAAQQHRVDGQKLPAELLADEQRESQRSANEQQEQSAAQPIKAATVFDVMYVLDGDVGIGGPPCSPARRRMIGTASAGSRTMSGRSASPSA